MTRAFRSDRTHRYRSGHRDDSIRGAYEQASPAQVRVLELQRLIGNHAVTELLQASQPGRSGDLLQRGYGVVVQRDPDPDEEEKTDSAREDSDTGAGRAAGVMDTLNNPAGAALGGSYLPSYSTAPTGGNAFSNAGSLASPSLSIVTGTMGAAVGAKRHYEASAERRQHREDGKKNDAKDRKLTRDMKSAAADTGQGVTSVVGNTLNVAYGAVNNYVGLAQTVAYPVASAAGAVTTPLSAFQAGRFIRKAEKARKRADDLKDLGKSEANPTMMLALAQDRVTKLLDAHTATQKSIAENEALLDTAKHGKARDKKYLDPSQIESSISDLEAERENLQFELDEATTALAEWEAVKDDMTKALEATSVAVRDASGSGTEDVSLLMIRAYAIKKNERGWVKKAINAAGAAVGAAGGAATLVASIALAAGVAAGAGALMATPIGWALAGAATAIGLGLATYQAWKYFNKRWHLTRHLTRNDPEGKKLGKMRRLALTLSVGQKLGPNKRDVYADILYTMASDDKDPRHDEAQKTVDALGLNWSELDMKNDPDSSKALIAAKFSS